MRLTRLSERPSKGKWATDYTSHDIVQRLGDIEEAIEKKVYVRPVPCCKCLYWDEKDRHKDEAPCNLLSMDLPRDKFWAKPNFSCLYAEPKGEK